MSETLYDLTSGRWIWYRVYDDAFLRRVGTMAAIQRAEEMQRWRTEEDVAT